MCDIFQNVADMHQYHTWIRAHNPAHIYSSDAPQEKTDNPSCCDSHTQIIVIGNTNPKSPTGLFKQIPGHALIRLKVISRNHTFIQLCLWVLEDYFQKIEYLLIATLYTRMLIYMLWYNALYQRKSFAFPVTRIMSFVTYMCDLCCVWLCQIWFGIWTWICKGHFQDIGSVPTPLSRKVLTWTQSVAQRRQLKRSNRNWICDCWWHFCIYIFKIQCGPVITRPFSSSFVIALIRVRCMGYYSVDTKRSAVSRYICLLRNRCDLNANPQSHISFTVLRPKWHHEW